MHHLFYCMSSCDILHLQLMIILHCEFYVLCRRYMAVVHGRCDDVDVCSE